MIIVPWLSLLFVKKEELKRFMPGALVAVITSYLILDMGVTLKWWAVRENIYPLNELFPIGFGFFLATTIWILKYTYGKIWLYTATQALLGVVLIFLVQPWFSNRGIWVRINVTNFLAYLPVVPHFLSIYLYQMWQEDALVPVVKKIFSTKPQPAATKPFFINENYDDNNK
jgi:hypothetical protein